MNTLPRHVASLFAPLLLILGAPLSAQWTGVGAGGSGTDFNDESNWSGGAINGDFSGITTSATVSLSDDITLSSLNFAWAGAGLALSINGSGVITLGGDMTVRRASSGTATTTFGSDVTLDFGTFSSTRAINSSGSGTNYGTVVINGLVSGTATGSAVLDFGQDTAVGVRLLNDSNSFTAPILIAGTLSFTSVANVNGGNSALGNATTVENGTITLRRNGQLNYIGDTDQTTDRRIVVNGGAGPVAINHAGGAGRLIYSSEIVGGSYANILNLRAGPAGTGKSDVIMEISGAITNSETGSMQVTINGSGNNGTVVLSNEANTYRGKTSLSGGGVLEVVKLADGGEASSIGMSSSDAANLVWGDWGDRQATLRYIGSGDSTDRSFTLPRIGGTIESSGTGALHFTNTGAISTAGASTRDTVNRVLTLGGTNAGDNTLALSLADHVYNGGANTTASRLVKTGTGKWILTGANTYTGNTSVSGGTLLVHGSLTSAVAVSAGVFGGAGSTTGTVTIGNGSGSRDSIFAAGAGSGAFTSNAALSFGSDGEFSYTFDSTAANTGFARANGITINTSAYFTFTDVGDGSGISLNQSITLLRSTGTSIAGTFVNLANNAEFTVNGITWRANYAGGTGGDLVLTAISVSAVPEPGSVAVWLGAAGFLAAGGTRRRRRNR